MVHQWLEHRAPSVVFPNSAKRLDGSAAEPVIKQGHIESSHHGVDISGGHSLSEAMTINLIGKVVTFGDHHRQRGPQVVKNAGPKRKGCFNVGAMGTHTHISLEQVVLAIVVINPRVVEEHLLTGHTQFFRQIS
jgi:hypothetical protein